MVEITIIPETIELIRLTDEEYFSPKYKDYISNSKLSLVDPTEGGSIDKYKEGYKSDYSESFELGSAVHMMLLQSELYTISHINKPSGKLGLFADKVYELEKSGVDRDEAIKQASVSANYYSGKLSDKRLATALEACIPYWEEREIWESNNENENVIYLSSGMLKKYDSCSLGLKENKKVNDTLYPDSLFGGVEVFNEYAIFAEVEINIDGVVRRLKVKAKLDNYTVNHETQELTLNDVKTTGKPIDYFMGNYVNVTDEQNNHKKVWYNGSFQKYHYYRQMGMYLWLLSSYYRSKGINYKLKANMVVVETIPEFKSKVYKVYNKHIKRGINEFKKLLALVANE